MASTPAIGSEKFTSHETSLPTQVAVGLEMTRDPSDASRNTNSMKLLTGTPVNVAEMPRSPRNALGTGPGMGRVPKSGAKLADTNAGSAATCFAENSATERHRMVAITMGVRVGKFDMVNVCVCVSVGGMKRVVCGGNAVSILRLQSLCELF